MGKGDKKTKRGKIIAGSYGKSRPKKQMKPIVTEVAVAEPEEKKASPKPKAVRSKKESSETAEEKPKTVRKKKTEE